MRIARGLVPLVAAAVATALAAPVASAQTVEVVTEFGTHQAIYPVQFHGELEVRGHVFGIEAHNSDCILELEGSVDEDGEGSITAASFSDHAGVNDCIRRPCGTASGAMTPWPIHIREPGTGSLRLHTEFCMENESDHSGAISGAAAGTMTPETGSHVYTTSYNDAPCVSHLNIRCELDGSFTSDLDASHPAFEVRHTP